MPGLRRLRYALVWGIFALGIFYTANREIDNSVEISKESSVQNKIGPIKKTERLMPRTDWYNISGVLSNIKPIDITNPSGEYFGMAHILDLSETTGSGNRSIKYALINEGDNTQALLRRLHSGVQVEISDRIDGPRILGSDGPEILTLDRIKILE